MQLLSKQDWGQRTRQARNQAVGAGCVDPKQKMGPKMFQNWMYLTTEFTPSAIGAA